MNFYQVIFTFEEITKVILSSCEFEAVGDYLIGVIQYEDIHDIVV